MSRTVGNQYLSGITLADIAIQSTAFKQPSTPTRQKTKSKRHVTFNLDNIQVRSIPSLEDISSEEDDEPLVILPSKKPYPPPPPVERISKKETYDALQHRKQMRRCNNKNDISKYWYPLCSSPVPPNPSLPKSTINEPKNEIVFCPMPLNQARVHDDPPTLTPQNEIQQRRPINSVLISDSDSEDSDDDFTSFRNLTPPLETDDSDISLKTASPEPPSYLGLDEKFQLEEIFEKTPPLTLPFEEKFMSISSRTSSLLHRVIPDYTKYKKRKLFFIQVSTVEQLDLPMDHDNTNVFCSIRNGNNESRSFSQPLSHTMQFNHQMRIIDIDPDQPICITLQIDSHRGKSNWYHKIKPSSDLYRYVHEQDGSICQTLFSPRRFMEQESTKQSASLMLLNGWYKAVLFRKKLPSREKAVGKLHIECMYLETMGDQMPEDMEQAVDGLNAKRIHQTIWQSGYMTQLGGNETEPIQRYFTLKGRVLCAFSRDDERVLLHQMSLSKVNKLMCDNRVIIERYNNQTIKTPDTLLRQLENVMGEHTGTDNFSRNATSEFELYFENGEKVLFQCESVREREKWVSIIKVMICKLPKLPSWIKV